MPGWRNPWIGFALAPLAAPALAGLLAAALTPLTGESHGLADSLHWFVAIVIGGAILSYPIALVLGLPLWLVFRGLGWRSLPHCVAGASVAGMLPVCLDLDVTGAGKLIAMYAAFGAVNGATFWLIVRPDRVRAPAGAAW